MPVFKQQFFAIDGLERLSMKELGDVIKMAIYAVEKPVTLNTSKGYINYPLFYPAIKNKGHTGFLNLGKSFSKDKFGNTLSSYEVRHIIEEGTKLSELVDLISDSSIYGSVKIKKQSRGRPNKLLEASFEMKLKADSYGTSLVYDLKGNNSQKSDDLLKSMPIGDLHHNLSIIEQNLTKIQNYVMDPDTYQEKWVSDRPVISDYDDYSTLDLLDFMSDWYWQAKYDEYFWSSVLDRPVNVVDPGDIISGAIYLGRQLGEMSKPVLDEFGKMIASSSGDLLEGVGDAIGGMLEGTKDMMKGMDSDDDGAAVVLLVIGGIALTALLTTGVVYGGIALRRELLDYNLIWLDREGLIIPNKSRLPLRLLKDIELKN